MRTGKSQIAKPLCIVIHPDGVSRGLPKLLNWYVHEDIETPCQWGRVSVGLRLPAKPQAVCSCSCLLTNFSFIWTCLLYPLEITIPLCRSLTECTTGKFTNCDQDQLTKLKKYIEQTGGVWPGNHYTKSSICGYSNSWKGKFLYASWCDPESSTPCCDPPNNVKLDKSSLHDFQTGRLAIEQTKNATCTSSIQCPHGISFLNFTWSDACDYTHGCSLGYAERWNNIFPQGDHF